MVGMCKGTACEAFAVLFALVLSRGHGQKSTYTYKPVDTSPRDCCFSDKEVGHGQVALTLPECCMVLQCNDGSIEKKLFGPPGSSNCCEFDGVIYPEGTYLSGFCAKLKCSRGSWIFDRLADCCAHCSLYRGSHLHTFDNFHVDWKTPCKYSLAQSDSNHNPHTAVFASYEPCAPSHSCLSRIVFKEGPDTVITIGPGAFDVSVNGDYYEVPVAGVHFIPSPESSVLVWRMDDCLYVLGSYKIMVVHCHLTVDVWAYPTLANSLDGLCGHFNYFVDDDLTTREGSVNPLAIWPLEFTNSWKTPDQTHPACRGKCYDCPDGIDPCQATNSTRRQHLVTCRQALHPAIGIDKQLDTEVVTCASVLCLMWQTGATEEQRASWIFNVTQIVYHRKITIARIEDKWEPSSPPSSGQCSPGASWMDRCNWCICSDAATAVCTQMVCDPDFAPVLGEAVCDDGTWWLLRDCIWCQCVRGGALCFTEACPIGTTVTTEKTRPPVTFTSSIPTPTPPTNRSVCLLPPDEGPCDLPVIRFYYSPLDGYCRTFQYGGCLGNYNNFLTFAECQTTCEGVLPTVSVSTTSPGGTTLPSRCLLPKDLGPCSESLPRYYYDTRHDDCRYFIYGGCGGNYNNFFSLDECRKVCTS